MNAALDINRELQHPVLFFLTALLGEAGLPARSSLAPTLALVLPWLSRFSAPLSIRHPPAARGVMELVAVAGAGARLRTWVVRVSLAQPPSGSEVHVFEACLANKSLRAGFFPLGPSDWLCVLHRDDADTGPNRKSGLTHAFQFARIDAECGPAGAFCGYHAELLGLGPAPAVGPTEEFELSQEDNDELDRRLDDFILSLPGDFDEDAGLGAASKPPGPACQAQMEQLQESFVAQKRADWLAGRSAQASSRGGATPEPVRWAGGQAPRRLEMVTQRHLPDDTKLAWVLLRSGDPSMRSTPSLEEHCERFLELYDDISLVRGGRARLTSGFRLFAEHVKAATGVVVTLAMLPHDAAARVRQLFDEEEVANGAVARCAGCRRPLRSQGLRFDALNSRMIPRNPFGAFCSGPCAANRCLGCAAQLCTDTRRCTKGCGNEDACVGLPAATLGDALRFLAEIEGDALKKRDLGLQAQHHPERDRPVPIQLTAGYHHIYFDDFHAF